MASRLTTNFYGASAAFESTSSSTCGILSGELVLPWYKRRASSLGESIADPQEAVPCPMKI